jgi:hypothetical protein
MKKHLSGPRISAWLAGERTPEEERHLSECPQCRAEVAGLENAVANFRGSFREWSCAMSNRDPLVRWHPQLAQRHSGVPPARWLLIAATLVVLVGVPIYRNAERQRAAAQARADALLMEQVDAVLSRPVPAPMEPLLSLVPGEFR